jgi:hypothetical protein
MKYHVSSLCTAAIIKMDDVDEKYTNLWLWMNFWISIDFTG